MYGEGKQMLRDHIKNKRAIEGLDEIPDDLFAKKPKHTMSEEEIKSMLERRKRNKEAAERSRKKKKVEFEKLQSENDQLNQEKCELVAMVQKLKADVTNVTKENEELRSNYEHLKRWIGKRSVELGLVKYIHPSDFLTRSSVAEGERMANPLTRGDPMLYSSDDCMIIDDRPPEDSGQHLSSSPKSGRSPWPREPSVDHYQPASGAVRNDCGAPKIGTKLQTPWLVEPIVKETSMVESNPDSPPAFNQRAAHFPENQPLVVASSQQVVYLPKDAVLVVQDDQRAVATGSPLESHQARTASPKIAMEASGPQLANVPRMNGSTASLRGNPKDDQAACRQGEGKKESSTSDIISSMDPATATAIEALLKLGYKIKMPGVTPEGPQDPQTTQFDHTYETPEVVTMPVNAPEPASSVTIASSGEREAGSGMGAFSPMNCVFQMKLKEAGYAVHAMPIGSIMKA